MSGTFIDVTIHFTAMSIQNSFSFQFETIVQVGKEMGLQIRLRQNEQN